MRKREKKYCVICGKELSKNNHSGYCFKHYPRCGENNPFFGKKHKKETIEAMKKKCSDASKKLWEDEGYRNKVVNGATGLKRSEEFKNKQRIHALKQFSDKHQRELRSENMHNMWQNGIMVYKKKDSINISKQEREFIEMVKALGYDVSHKTFRYKDGNRKRHLFPDGIIEEKKIILEYNGSFWHADPNRGYKSDDIIHHGATASEIWKRDNFKRQIYEENGYFVYTVWSDEFLTNKEESLKKFKKFIENFDLNYDKKIQA